MTNEERQALLDNVPDEELAKIRQAQGNKVLVEPEDLLLAEFGIKFGWEAYKEARDDKIKAKEMNRLIAASRKLDNLELYRNSMASYIGVGAVNSKSPSKSFKSMTSKLSKSTEADV